MQRSRPRRVALALLTGVLLVSSAWAGVGLAPVNEVSELVEEATRLPGGTSVAERAAIKPGRGQFLVGAAKVSIEPKPKAYDGVWEKEGCATLDEDTDVATLEQLPDGRMPWPERPNCLYSGGYGIGPMNPITSWDKKYGLWVRALYLSDGKDAVALVLLDGTSYFGHYGRLCEGCGALDLAAELGQKLKFDPAGFMLVSTHSHTSPDFIGGWGGVPDWYMRQVADAVRTAVTQAHRARRPAVLRVGEVIARRFSGERRDFYRSAEDATMSWLRATDARTGRGIATLGAFAAHPVTADESKGIANADFPGVFAKRVEQRFGGVGMYFQTGLGNMSPRGETEEMGNGLAALLPSKGGQAVAGTDIKVGRHTWNQPITNAPLGTLGAMGFFDRPFGVGGAVQVGENAERACRSASPLAVETSVSGALVGDVWITGAPGETFANLSNTIEEKAPSVAFALSQANDGLGYLMQSFETDHLGRQGVGFVGSPAAEYEDAFGIDHCFGDAALEYILGLMGRLSAPPEGEG